MDSPSGLFKAGKILLLVGAILQAVGALFLLLGSMGLGFLNGELEGQDDALIVILRTVYTILGIVSAAGAVLGFLAYGKARAGDARRAFVLGLIGCLLPPVQLLGLLGAIFCKVSPEGDRPRQVQ